ncbi:hypothetical protein IV203_025488 [Nitzschia inconspicua]|uniref:Uncharacterized protein n=1 Tax=Nitzschia inconspicua TaxID=303405 RepID=A0A9K3LIW5_9STRA|nr:hypothetical protein IV203_025488 [Nitzschia inconspicua]
MCQELVELLKVGFWSARDPVRNAVCFSRKNKTTLLDLATWIGRNPPDQFRVCIACGMDAGRNELKRCFHFFE